MEYTESPPYAGSFCLKKNNFHRDDREARDEFRGKNMAFIAFFAVNIFLFFNGD